MFTLYALDIDKCPVSGACCVRPSRALSCARVFAPDRAGAASGLRRAVAVAVPAALDVLAVSFHVAHAAAAVFSPASRAAAGVRAFPSHAVAVDNGVGKPGKSPGPFGEAHFLAVTPKLDIYVSDTLSVRLKFAALEISSFSTE